MTAWRYGDWVKQLEILKQQCPASTSAHDDAVVPKQKKATLLTKAKKNITGKVVSSSVGRDALKSILDEETRENFSIFKQLLVSEFGEEKANALESDMIKLVVKGYLWVFFSPLLFSSYCGEEMLEEFSIFAQLLVSKFGEGRPTRWSLI